MIVALGSELIVKDTVDQHRARWSAVSNPSQREQPFPLRISGFIFLK